jgi:hypothetical protein
MAKSQFKDVIEFDVRDSRRSVSRMYDRGEPTVTPSSTFGADRPVGGG